MDHHGIIPPVSQWMAKHLALQFGDHSLKLGKGHLCLWRHLGTEAGLGRGDGDGAATVSASTSAARGFILRALLSW